MPNQPCDACTQISGDWLRRSKAQGASKSPTLSPALLAQQVRLLQFMFMREIQHPETFLLEP